MLSHSQKPFNSQNIFPKNDTFLRHRKRNPHKVRRRMKKNWNLNGYYKNVFAGWYFYSIQLSFWLFFSAKMRFYQLNDLCNDFSEHVRHFMSMQKRENNEGNLFQSWPLNMRESWRCFSTIFVIKKLLSNTKHIEGTSDSSRLSP